jgi:hypothetical protein
MNCVVTNECRSKRCMYVLTVKEKNFKTKYRPSDLLVIVKDMISYKIKLNLKSKNKNLLQLYVSVQIYSKKIH